MEPNDEIKMYPVIPKVFIKKAIQSSSTKEELLNKLKEFAKYNDNALDEVIYFFIKESFKKELYFLMSEDVGESLLYEAIYWASLNESRKKTRPKSYKDIKEGKKNAFFTQLQKELIKYLFKTEDTESPKFDITLERYISFFFDLSCIKRNRRCKDEEEN